MVSSFSALFIYIKQADIMREQTKGLLEQTKANAWPNLKISLSRNTSKNGIEKYRLSLLNRGIGPAIIEGVVFKYKDKVFRNWYEFYL